MDDVRGDFLGLPHGTTPAAVIANKNKLRSFKSICTRVTVCRLRQFSQESGSSTTDSLADEESDHFSDGDETEYETKQRILAASLPFVHTHGWTQNAIAKGAEVEGMPGVAHGLFTRGGADLVFYFYADCNRRLADQLAAEVKAQKQAEEGAQPPEPRSKVGPFIKMAVERRLRMITPYIDKWPQAIGIMSLPQNIPEALSNLTNLTDEIWYHAGDESTDINWYTKRAMLAGIYKSTEIYMLQDKSEDFQDTWEFLDRRVEDVSALGKKLRSGQQSSQVLSEALYGLCIMGKNILGMNSRSK